MAKDIAIFVESSPKGTDRKFLEELIQKRISQALLERIKWEHSKDGSVKGVIQELSTRMKDSEYKGGNIKTVLIIVDADEKIEQRFQDIQQALEERQDKCFSLPQQLGVIAQDKQIKVGVFLFPDNQKSGSLETLCLKALNQKQREAKLDCVEQYFACLRSKSIDPQTENNAAKAKFRILLATPDPDRYVKSIVTHLDYSSSEFDLLVNFLKQVG